MFIKEAAPVIVATTALFHYMYDITGYKTAHTHTTTLTFNCFVFTLLGFVYILFCPISISQHSSNTYQFVTGLPRIHLQTYFTKPSKFLADNITSICGIWSFLQSMKNVNRLHHCCLVVICHQRPRLQK